MFPSSRTWRARLAAQFCGTSESLRPNPFYGLAFCLILQMPFAKKPVAGWRIKNKALLAIPDETASSAYCQWA
ncbi:hypothetical protein CQ010_10170 [Arthrobacter sp. MYb211]|uniref:hypothetical protein n=1 Tax=Glutamicibacter sp. AOP12-B1-11 TaxID=3457725 RepID=UPI000CFC76DF|nr:hypothetical protein CQ015_09970 [Arthrobacter sp. MYb221]PRC07626.1 hypothetical protein CQ010_10170 [Arthrobacter sp. MYb211]